MSTPHPIIVFIRGLTGSGKSYLARALQAEIGHDGCTMLDPDDIDFESDEYKQLSAELTADGVEDKFHPNQFLRKKGFAGIDANHIVIWNQAFTLLGGLQRTAAGLQDYAKEHNKDAPLLVVEVDIDVEVARRRTIERAEAGGHAVDDENFQRFVNDYRSFADEGFNVVSVRGDDDVSKSVETVITAIKELV